MGKCIQLYSCCFWIDGSTTNYSQMFVVQIGAKGTSYKLWIAYMLEVLSCSICSERSPIHIISKEQQVGGGFKYFLCSSLFGEMIQFDWYFSTGLKPPTRQLCTLQDHSPQVTFLLKKRHSPGPWTNIMDLVKTHLPFLSDGNDCPRWLNKKSSPKTRRHIENTGWFHPFVLFKTQKKNAAGNRIGRL